VRLGLVAPPIQRIRQDETINVALTGQSGTSWSDTSGPHAITVPAWAKLLYVPVRMTSANTDNTLHARVRIALNYSTELSSMSNLARAVLALDVSALSGARDLYFQSYYTPGSGGNYSLYCATGEHVRSYTYRRRTIDFEQGLLTDT
jgi:hypothetical protein